MRKKVKSRGEETESATPSTSNDDKPGEVSRCNVSILVLYFNSCVPLSGPRFGVVLVRKFRISFLNEFGPVNGFFVRLKINFFLPFSGRYTLWNSAFSIYLPELGGPSIENFMFISIFFKIKNVHPNQYSIVSVIQLRIFSENEFNSGKLRHGPQFALICSVQK